MLMNTRSFGGTDFPLHPAYFGNGNNGGHEDPDDPDTTIEDGDEDDDSPNDSPNGS